MHVETVADPVRFAGLRGEWNRLLERAPVDGVFLSWEWLHAWWETFGRPPLVLGLVRGTDGELHGIAPMYRQREVRKGLLASSVLRLLGDSEIATDDLDLVVDPAAEPEVLSALGGWLASQSWDQLVLCHLDVRGSFAARLVESALASAGPGLWLESYRLPCPRIVLQPTTELWWTSLSANRRTLLSRKERRAAELGARTRLMRGEEAATRGLDILFELHRRRWAAMGMAREDNLRRPEVERFHRTAAAGLAERDLLRCWVLEHEEGPLAVLYGFACRGRFLFFQIGHDPATDKLSPGALVMAASIRGAIDEGLGTYEMLRGAEDYKRHWQNDVRFIKTVRASAWPRRWGTTLILAERCRRALERLVVSARGRDELA